MKLTLRSEAPMLFVIALMFAAAAMSWNQVPELLPTHWNAAGEVDGTGGRGMGLLFLPIITLFSYLLTAFIPRIDPGRANIEKFAGPYNLFRLAFVLFMAGIYAAMHATFRGFDINMTMVLMPLMGMLFVTVGWMLRHVQPNWSIGIRTPWTLTSRLAWDRSHRLGSKLFMIAGLFFVLTGIIGKPWAIGVAVGGMILVTFILIGYSYVVWKGDPDRVPPR